MTTLWAWESAAPTAGGCGLSDDKARAQKAAADWMQGHGADRAVLEQVQLVCAGIDPLYLPVGARRSFEATRGPRGEVRWRARPPTAAA